MGMYDTLANGEQIKIFPIPVFYSSDSIFENKLGAIGGNLRYFGFGDEVPYKTLGYKYPDTFIAVDAREWDGNNEFIIHCFKDGVYEATIEDEKDLRAFDLVAYTRGHEIFTLDYWGGKVHNIHNADDLLDYISMFKKVRRELNELIKPDEFFKYLSTHRENADPKVLEKLHAEHVEKEKKLDEERTKVIAPLKEKYTALTDEDLQEEKLGNYGAYLDVFAFHMNKLDEAEKSEDINYESQICTEIYEEWKRRFPDDIHQQYLDWLKPTEGMRETIDKAKSNLDMLDRAEKIREK